MILLSLVPSYQIPRNFALGLVSVQRKREYSPVSRGLQYSATATVQHYDRPAFTYYELRARPGDPATRRRQVKTERSKTGYIRGTTKCQAFRQNVSGSTQSTFFFFLNVLKRVLSPLVLRHNRYVRKVMGRTAAK